MRTLWARVGVSFEVTEEEYQELLAEHRKSYDVEICDGWIGEHKHEFDFDGDSYIPGNMFEEEEL